MISGVYQSATGLDSLAKMQETMANNLANISTHGFKEELVQVEKTRAGRLATTKHMDFQNGAVQVTGEKLDMALGQDQLFTVATPQGLAYTRNGNFGLDEQGRLISGGQWPVQGEQGDIILPNGAFTVSENGDILVEGESVDRLMLVKADRPLQALGNGLMVTKDGTALETLESHQGQVMQGALEGSNVNGPKSMVELISIVRLYEANQQAMMSQDETLKDAVNTIGRVM